MDISISEIEKIISIEFINKDFLKQAFTHRSYLNENKNSNLSHNERLEFLGDAVLELVITEFLYEKFPEKTEGELTLYRSALVNTQILGKVSNDLGLNKYLLTSKGEAKDQGRARVHLLANLFEAISGAIYVDQGYEKAKEFISQNLFGKIDEVISKKAWIDNKSLFQEKAQEHYSITPKYELISEEGPDHNKVFTVGVYIGDEKVAEGSGKSKQDAEQMAAEVGLEEKGWR